MGDAEEAAGSTHSLTELGDGLEVPGDPRRHLADLTPDYTVSRYPNAANAVPYELYDHATARTKVQNAEAVMIPETPEQRPVHLRAGPSRLG